MAQQNLNTQETANDMLSQSTAFINKNKKKLIICTVAVLVVIGAVFGFLYGYKKPHENKGQAYISKANEYAMQGLQAKMSGQDSLVTVYYTKALNGDGQFPGLIAVAGYKFTNVSNVAKAMTGFCYYNMGKIKEAIEYLEDFSPAGDESLSPAALATLANCYASDNRVDDAVKTLKKAAEEADNFAVSPVYLLQVGELLESQKKNDEALEVYQQIKKDYPESELCIPGQSPDGTPATPEIERYITRVSK